MNYNLFISCPRGLEYLLEDEVKHLGLDVERVSPMGVYGEASQTVLYNLCIYSRLANRIQLILFQGEACNDQAITQLCKEFHWQTVFSHDKTFAVEFHGKSRQIRNTMYGAQLVKDGIVDHFKGLNLPRPTVDKNDAQIRIQAHLKHNQLTVSFDLCGYSLHQRGYRAKAGAAPIKENLACALLIRAQWPKLAEKGYALHDPCCGSGTLVIEAAMMAAGIAPGLLRNDQSLQHWAQHQPNLWQHLRESALAAVKPISNKITGSDKEKNMVYLARQNAEKAGVKALVSFEQQEMREGAADAEHGLVICNPPYGERLDDLTRLTPFYQQMGQVLAEQYPGWQAAILCSNQMLAKSIGLRANKQYNFHNGALEVKLYCFDIHENNRHLSVTQLSSGAEMLFNRLQKNARHLGKWAKKNDIHCYRLYDADLPEYAFAMDRYNDFLVIQEYKAPAKIADHKVEKRALEVLQTLPRALDLPAENIIFKQRQKQKGKSQYQKLNSDSQTITVKEGSALFKVNLYDYLDTGLFLDHRPIRLSFEKLKPGTRFLNCFCYTASASVHAALAGAKTWNVDMSRTYLNWAKDNFRLNRLTIDNNEFIQEDVLTWLKTCRQKFDVIFLDPPSFSNSKRMNDVFDVQVCHQSLIEDAMKLLAEDGVMYFSTNLRKFKLDASIAEHYQLEDISQQTIDVDFKKNPSIHHCFKLKNKI